MSLIERLPARLVATVQKRSLIGMIRLACWIGLVALAVMVASILYPMPLLIIFATSVGQMIGIAAFLCYLLSILMDIVRGADHAPDAPGPARKFRASSDPPSGSDS
jgi:hypothetical protein